MDDEDYEMLSKFNWSARKRRQKFYAQRSENRTTILMHRHILGLTDPHIQVDHIFGNGLDNQKKHLRICKNIENSRNRKINSNNKTGFKGVFWFRGKFYAKITLNGKKIHLGTFDSAETAALAYDEAAKVYFGEFAKLNFSNIKEPPEYSIQHTPQSPTELRLGIKNTTGFLGVVFDRSRNKYRAQIVINKKTFNLGRFNTVIEAAMKYDSVSKHHFGESAKVNFP